MHSSDQSGFLIFFMAATVGDEIVMAGTSLARVRIGKVTMSGGYGRRWCPIISFHKDMDSH